MGYPNVISLYLATLLAFNAPDGWVNSHGTISVKFCTAVKGGRLGYKMTKKYCREFQPPEYRRTKVTDDGRICDSKDLNVMYIVTFG